MKASIKDYRVLHNNRRNIIACLTKGTSDFFLLWWGAERVKFQELKDNIKPQDPVIRISSITSDKCEIQYRATQPLTKYGYSKHLIATALFCKEDLEFILQQMKDQEKLTQDEQAQQS